MAKKVIIKRKPVVPKVEPKIEPKVEPKLVKRRYYHKGKKYFKWEE